MSDSNLKKLFEEFLACEPSFDELNDLLGDIKSLTDDIYPYWEKKLNELLLTEPKEPERTYIISSLERVLKWDEVKMVEVANKLLSLNPEDSTIILIMKKLPSYEERLLPMLKSQKKRLFYLMKKEEAKNK